MCPETPYTAGQILVSYQALKLVTPDGFVKRFCLPGYVKKKKVWCSCETSMAMGKMQAPGGPDARMLSAGGGDTIPVLGQRIYVEEVMIGE